jgi:hypothetical protein
MNAVDAAQYSLTHYSTAQINVMPWSLVRRNIQAMWPMTDSRRGTKTMSNKMKIISATAVAAALLATVAVARTVQTHVTAVQATSGQAIATIPHSAPFVRHDNFACALPNEAECEKIETLLPK